MTAKFQLLFLAIFATQFSLAFAEPMNTAEALALLSPANHTINPCGLPQANATEEEKRLQLLEPRQLIAIKYIRDNNIEAGIPNLIMYIDYAIAPGLGDPAHGEDIENVKNNYIAFGALIDMPDTAPFLKDYCLNKSVPLGARLAALFALTFVDKAMFDSCWLVLKNSHKGPKVQRYLDNMKAGQGQYLGIPDVD